MIYFPLHNYIASENIWVVHDSAWFLLRHQKVRYYYLYHKLRWSIVIAVAHLSLQLSLVIHYHCLSILRHRLINVTMMIQWLNVDLDERKDWNTFIYLPIITFLEYFYKVELIILWNSHVIESWTLYSWITDLKFVLCCSYLNLFLVLQNLINIHTISYLTTCYWHVLAFRIYVKSARLQYDIIVFLNIFLSKISSTYIITRSPVWDNNIFVNWPTFVQFTENLREDSSTLRFNITNVLYCMFWNKLHTNSKNVILNL